MDAFLTPRNGAILIIIDVTAHSISFFKKRNNLNIPNYIFILQTGISIAEPIGVQIDELGNAIIQMYQFNW